jgi:hypothetical protein
MLYCAFTLLHAVKSVAPLKTSPSTAIDWPAGVGRRAERGLFGRLVARISLPLNPAAKLRTLNVSGRAG